MTSCEITGGVRESGELNVMRGFHFVLLLALSGLAFVGLGASARALTVEPSGDIVIVTFTGTVNYSTDPNGIFGCGVTIA